MAFTTALASRAAVAIDNAAPYREVEARLEEQKRGELALRVAHDRTAMARDTARMGAWEYDIVAGKLYWSDRADHLEHCVPRIPPSLQV